MEYVIPTTKEEMYNTLNELYMYYRYHLPEYEEEELLPLDIPKMEFNKLTDEELAEKADVILAPSQEERLIKAKETINERLAVAEKGIETANQTAKANLDALNLKYEIQKKDAIDRLLEGKITVESDYYVINGYEYSEEQDPYEEEYQKLTQINEEIIAQATAVYNSVLAEFNGLEEYYAELFEKEKQAKIIELSEEQEKTEREVFKYNNAIEEKSQRYQNSLKQGRATLKLKYLTIQQEGLTKEQLVNLGYYQAVMNVVYGYYDRLSVADAYVDIKNEYKLALYLDDFYEDMVYLYHMKATT